MITVCVSKDPNYAVWSLAQAHCGQCFLVVDCKRATWLLPSNRSLNARDGEIRHPTSSLHSPSNRYRDAWALLSFVVELCEHFVRNFGGHFEFCGVECGYDVVNALEPPVIDQSFMSVR
jgi:hypothetical protein